MYSRLERYCNECRVDFDDMSDEEMEAYCEECEGCFYQAWEDKIDQDREDGR